MCYNKHMQDGSIVGDFFRNKWVRLILVLDIVAIIVIIAVAIVNSLKTAVIEFNVTPINSVISVNGDSSYSNGSYRFFPGTYEITVSREGLDPKTFILELGNNDVQTVALFLSNNGNFDFYALKENYSSFAKLAEIASAANNLTIDHDTSAEKFIEEFENNYALFDDLPIVDYTPSQYGLDYGVRYQYDIFKIEDGRTAEECIKTLCLRITDTLVGRKYPVESILRNLGYDPDAYQIIYQETEYE